MGKEFIWGIGEHDARTEFKVLVEDGICLTYEDGVLTNRLPYSIPEDGKALWIDEVIEVRGKRCPFQIEIGIPYLKLGGKWVASDTTVAERKVELLESEMRSSRMLATIGVFLIALTGVMCLIRPADIRYWLIAALVGVAMIVNGIIQYNSVRKKLNA